MNDFTIKVSGLPEINKALYSYSQQLGDKVALASLREGAKLVQREARQAAPRKTGRLARAIVIKRSRIHTAKRGGLIGVYLTIRTGKGKGDPKDGFYGRWQEKGWNVRGQARNAGNTPGKWNRRGSKFLLSKGAIRSAGFRGGRTTLPGKLNVLGKFFVRDSFLRNRETAVRLIIAAASSGAELLAHKTGLKGV